MPTYHLDFDQPLSQHENRILYQLVQSRLMKVGDTLRAQQTFTLTTDQNTTEPYNVTLSHPITYQLHDGKLYILIFDRLHIQLSSKKNYYDYFCAYIQLDDTQQMTHVIPIAFVDLTHPMQLSETTTKVLRLLIKQILDPKIKANLNQTVISAEYPKLSYHCVYPVNLDADTTIICQLSHSIHFVKEENSWRYAIVNPITLMDGYRSKIKQIDTLFANEAVLSFTQLRRIIKIEQTPFDPEKNTYPLPVHIESETNYWMQDPGVSEPVIGVLLKNEQLILKSSFTQCQWLGEDLHTWITDDVFATIDYTDKLNIICQLLKLALHLEKGNRINLDIKPENCILHFDQNNTPILRMLDFGMVNIDEEIDNCSGTLGFLAPELIDKPTGEKRRISAKTPIWSLAINIIILLSGYEKVLDPQEQVAKLDPNSIENSWRIYHQLPLEKKKLFRYSLADIYSTTPNIPSTHQLKIYTQIKQMLQETPTLRPELSVVVKVFDLLHAEMKANRNLGRGHRRMTESELDKAYNAPAQHTYAWNMRAQTPPRLALSTGRKSNRYKRY